MRVKIFGVIAFALLTSIVSAAPDANSSSLTWLLWNASLVVESLTTMFTSIMAVFMEPPLVLYVGISIFGFVVGIVAKYMLGRGRK